MDQNKFTKRLLNYYLAEKAMYYTDMGLIHKGWYGMFVACGMWCLAQWRFERWPFVGADEKNLISVYKPRDVGISSNLIGSLSLANGIVHLPGGEQFTVWNNDKYKLPICGLTVQEIVQFLACVALSPSLYLLIQLFSSTSVTSCF